jgi:uncharacterized protein (TIGR02594 family)
MTTFATFDAAFLFKDADLGSTRLGVVPKATVFEGVTQSNGFVKARIPSVSPDIGFVFMDGFVEELQTEPVPLHARDVDAFCALVTRAAREASSDRDYLMAVAYALSDNLADMGPSKDGRVGPFRYNETEWAELIALQGAKDYGLVPEDRFRWHRQPIAAAFRTAQDVKHLMGELGALPSFKELHYFQLVGPDSIVALKSPKRLCRDFISGNPAAESFAAGLKAGTSTVEQALVALQKQLEKGYAAALEVIDRQPPGIRFFRSAPGLAPWMAVAREQMESGVSETPAGRNTAQIQAYFSEIGMAQAPDDTPWCAAFVAYCMKRCGNDTIAASVDDSTAAGTKFWEGWGDPSSDDPPRVGAVVVLKPQGSSGHVGFAAEGSTKEVVKLLGGNQGSGGGQRPDHVGIVEFPVASNPIIAVRWKDVSGAASPAAGAGDATFVQKAPQVMQALIEKLDGLTPVQAAGILGNIGQECGGFTQLRQSKIDNVGGYGWCQWDGTRRTDFLAFAERAGRPWSDESVNLDFLILELTDVNRENAALRALLKTSVLEDAVVVFNDRFERSGVPMMEKRIRYAQIALQAYQSQFGTG